MDKATKVPLSLTPVFENPISEWELVIPVTDPEQGRILLGLIKREAKENPVAFAPDTMLIEMSMEHDKPAEVVLTDEKGALHTGLFTKVKSSFPFHVAFSPVEGGVGCVLAGQAVRINLPPENCAEIHSRLEERNAFFEYPTPIELLPEAHSVETFALHTSQEIDILQRSACDGYTGSGWRNEEMRRARVYEPKGANHRVELSLTADDESSGSSLDSLTNLTMVQDADFAFVLLYALSVLASPSPIASNRAAYACLDLDDIATKIGWQPHKFSLEKRAELRARIWNYLLYGDRAMVIGERIGTYKDRATGETIETTLESPVWRVMGVERPLQRALFGEVPRRVEVVLSKQWEPLLNAPSLAQYFPLGEVLASIPPHKAAGDWARSIGLVLASFWRRKPREVMADTLRPTRRELLTRYRPKTSSVTELLESKNPQRAVKYWHDALAILVEKQFLAKAGEAASPSRSKDLSGYGWQQRWLDEKVDLRPGPLAEAPVWERAAALPAKKPVDLRKGSRQSKTRSAKTPAS